MMQSSPIESQSPQLGIDLSSLSGYESFGAMIKTIRTRHNITQQQFAEVSKPYFRSRKLPTLTFHICSALEKNRLRAPHFEELEALYLTLTDAESFNIRLSPRERELFVLLARKRIDEKRKQKEHIDPEQWDKLAERLANLDGSRRSKIYLLPKHEELDQAQVIEPEDSRRLKALHDILHTDTSHLLERDAWLERMVSYLTVEQQRKLVTIQGHMGIGKSHALALLTQRLASLPDYYLIPYRFSFGEGKTSEDQLDTFLATLHADLLGSPVTDTMQQPPFAERMEQVFSAIKQRGKVVLLLDDAQEIFSSATEWPSAWQQFFLAFVKEPHTSTMFLASRLWPGWPDRRLTYIEQTELPPLSLESGVRLWKRAGFTDVPEQLLCRVSERYGGNPQVIEMKASSLKRPGFTLSWKTKGKHDLLPSNAQENEHTTLIKRLLDEDAIFTDIHSRKMLTQVITGRLSHQATQMLEMLAVSPLGLPFSLLDEEFRDFEIAYDELVRASLVDLNAAASNRATAVPLVREAQLQALTSDDRLEGIEARVTDLYAHWLHEVQDFRDDAEQAALIAEMVVRYIRQRQLLKAAELFISFGWLCVLFGHVTQIQHVYDEVVKEDRGKEEDVKHEVGRLILQHHVGLKMGQKITAAERVQIYQHIYNKVLAGEVALQAYSEIDVLHHLLIMYLRKSLFTEASQTLDETLARLQTRGQLTPEIHASYLNNKARLFARWWEKVEDEHNYDEVQHLRQECVATLKETIARWRHCLRNALPLQTHYVNFKMARTLNDYAYRQRLVGNLVEAQDAIEESLHLKKASGALPHSLAISLSEYSQILALQGDIRKALTCNEEAIVIIERLIDEGDTSHNPELGVFLTERADILKQQARLEDTKALLERAVPLIGDKPSRQHFHLKAKQGIEEISFILETGQVYQLDKRWFSRYLELASYDSLAWLAYAGPFIEDEQQEWEQLLSHREEEEASARMTTLIVQSRQREFARSQEEKHAPKLWYPFIPLDEVQNLIKKFGQLQKEIEKQETNAIVRSQYIDAINEQIVVLRQCEATALGNQDTVWQCNLSLYGKPNTREVFIALQSLCEMAFEAQNHEKVGPVAQDVLRQLKAWGLSPHDIAAMEFFSSKQEPVPSFRQKLSDGGRKFSHTVVQQFFQDVFAEEYHADDWNVEIAPARDGVSIDVNLKTLFLPPKSFSLDKIRELLAEEIETHAYRSMSGLRSPLALLGSGLARYGATEEGLANHYIQQVSSHIHGDEKSKTWIGTLATGLASGVLTPALSFYELATFLEKTFLISKLLSGKSITWNETVTVARQQAWSRAARTFRGVPHLEEAGGCSLKDVIYLRGYLTVKQVLEQEGEQRLLVGKMGIEHLDALAELNIVTPYYPLRHLALAPDLLDRLSQYKA